jgi:hypothetical protein
MKATMKQVFARATHALAIFAFGSGYALAHEEFRIIGTLTKHENSQIQVQGRDGQTRSIKLDQQTVITKDDAKVDAAALTAGNSVVVDALGDSLEDLLAVEIRIVPPIASR